MMKNDSIRYLFKIKWNYICVCDKIMIPNGLEKIEMFQFLIQLGFKEIEIGFPAASQIEYDFLRQLVDRKMIPDDVCVQVLTQCREELIDRTFESIEGCKQAIVHIYRRFFDFLIGPFPFRIMYYGVFPVSLII